MNLCVVKLLLQHGVCFTDYTTQLSYFSGIEVNFMDDVGQTLLNWASAFGTQEMVEFLCDRGADVNKGKPAIPTRYHSWV